MLLLYFQVNQQLTDDVLCRMSEAELRLWMEHAQKNEFIDEMSYAYKTFLHLNRIC